MASASIAIISRADLVAGGPARLFGEETIFSVSPHIEITVKSDNGRSYVSVRGFCCTSHRLYYSSDSDIVEIRFDLVNRATVRGGLLRSSKIVIEMFEKAGGDLSIRVGSKDEFDALLSALNKAITGKAWIRTSGFIPHPRIGGVSRVVARVDQSVYQQGTQIDSGLSDLDSLRVNAKQLKETITSLKRGGSDPEVSEINALLNEYGLLSSLDNSSANGGSTSIEPSVQTAVSSANGVMLVHDLFCLVNRKLRIERSLSPREFIDNLAKIPSVQLINVCGYMVVISLRLTDINARTTDLLRNSGPLSESVIGSSLGILNAVVLHLLLLKSEELFGTLLRDQHDVVTWYVNNLI